MLFYLFIILSQTSVEITLPVLGSTFRISSMLSSQSCFCMIFPSSDTLNELGLRVNPVNLIPSIKIRVNLLGNLLIMQKSPMALLANYHKRMDNNVSSNLYAP